VAAQVAVCLVLLVSAGLFFRTARNAARQDMGFDMKNRLVMATDTGMRRYEKERTREFYRQLMERVRALPGVQAAALGRYLPIGFNTSAEELLIDGRPQEPDKPLPFAFLNIVDPEYFRTMGMPILQGRGFTENDKEESPRVVVINDTMAQKFWPGQDPIGRRFRIHDSKEGPLEVVGVTRTVKWVLPAERPYPGYYVPYAQRQRDDMVLHVHTHGDPLQMVSAVRAEMAALDPEISVWDVRTLEEHILHGKMFLFDLAIAIVGAFGLIGMALAAVGLYGVMAFMVSQRTHEIGVRMALGASGGNVLGMVVRQGLVKAAIGLALGLVLAFAVTRLMTNYLVGVAPTDPLTFGTVAVFLVAVAVLASLAPALRATRVDPMIALRSE
jgi:predicted permease